MTLKYIDHDLLIANVKKAIDAEITLFEKQIADGLYLADDSDVTNYKNILLDQKAKPHASWTFAFSAKPEPIKN